MTLVVIIGLGLLIGLALWWLLIETEGVYLGRRVVIWLYDVYATRYDHIVQHDEIEEHLTLAQPLMERIAPQTKPLILDVATGTGRLPLALCQHARFEGHIIGVDLSQAMLKQAAEKISANHFTDYVTVGSANGQDLPFADNSFDVVTCLEALEFMPDPEIALAEWVRVLRPGGLLLTTCRQNITMPGRIWSTGEMRRKMTALALYDIDFEVWQYDYMKVWARKAGTSALIGSLPLREIPLKPDAEPLEVLPYPHSSLSSL